MPKDIADAPIERAGVSFVGATDAVAGGAGQASPATTASAELDNTTTSTPAMEGGGSILDSITSAPGAVLSIFDSNGGGSDEGETDSSDDGGSDGGSDGGGD